MAFTRATKARVAPKIAIAGVSGSGKTYSALRFARELVGSNARVAFVDTENGSAAVVRARRVRSSAKKSSASTIFTTRNAEASRA